MRFSYKRVWWLSVKEKNYKPSHTVDAVGLACGDLIMKVFNEIKRIKAGEILHVIAYDLGAIEDLPAWCRMQKHELLHVEETGLIITHFYIRKGDGEHV